MHALWPYVSERILGVVQQESAQASRIHLIAPIGSVSALPVPLAEGEVARVAGDSGQYWETLLDLSRPDGVWSPQPDSGVIVAADEAGLGA